jgi:hypothetical protein
VIGRLLYDALFALYFDGGVHTALKIGRGKSCGRPRIQNEERFNYNIGIFTPRSCTHSMASSEQPDLKDFHPCRLGIVFPGLSDELADAREQ